MTGGRRKWHGGIWAALQTCLPPKQWSKWHFGTPSVGHEKLRPIGRPVACPEFPRKKSYRCQTTMLERPQWDFSQWFQMGSAFQPSLPGWSWLRLSSLGHLPVECQYVISVNAKFFTYKLARYNRTVVFVWKIVVCFSAISYIAIIGIKSKCWKYKSEDHLQVNEP